MKIYDCHIHSNLSFDGKESIEDLCLSAIEKGASAITITEHTLSTPEGFTGYEHVTKSIETAKKLSKKYSDKLLVLSGAERDDATPITLRESYYDLDIDCILGSCHSKQTFREYFPDCGYTDIVTCSANAPLEFVSEVVKKYFHKLADMAYYGDVDVITHLTFLFRYINGYNMRGLEIEPFYPEIDNILKGIIETEKSLEINTSGKKLEWNQFMPNAQILKRYYDMGGRSITLGSDAHTKENIAIAFHEAAAMLKEIGFTHGNYFIKRKKYEYEL